MVVFPLGIYPMLLDLKIILFSWIQHTVLGKFYPRKSSVVSCTNRLKPMFQDMQMQRQAPTALPHIKPEMLDFNPTWS